MRKSRLLSIVLAGALALAAVAVMAAGFAASPQTAYADGESEPAVIYDAQDKKLYGEGISESQLAEAFSDMVPGDTHSFTFMLRAEHLSGAATFYLASDFTDEVEDLLEGAQVSVDVDGSRAGEGVVGEQDALTQGVKLIMLKGDGTASVTINVALPTSAGNETMGRTLPLDWLITVADESDLGGGSTDGSGGAESSKPSAQGSLGKLLPKTGDESLMPIAVAVCCGAIVLAAGLVLSKR